MKSVSKNSKYSDLLFILWAGGAALLSYSMVYALRKPYTAASFEDIFFMGMDYKVAVTVIQIAGYVLAKFIGIKLISELKKEKRLSYIIGFALMAELSLILFGILPLPFNVVAMFINGLSLGCMWGIIFSYLEGRRLTDILASLMGVSMVISSGTAKSVGLYVMNVLHINEFWMPALIGAIALPILSLLAWFLNRLPLPTDEDIKYKCKREELDKAGRKKLYKEYMPFLTVLFIANILLVILRDIKEDFLVNIIDVSNYSSWLFAQIDSIVTVIILMVFGLMVFIKDNLKVLMILLFLITIGTCGLTFISFNHEQLQLSPVVWLFLQSLFLYIAYLTFQTIFFDRFIACFKIKGNVGYFIAMNDFLGYAGTVLVLILKEFINPNINWSVFYNTLAGYVGIVCCLSFIYSVYYLYQRATEEKVVKEVKVVIAPVGR